MTAAERLKAISGLSGVAASTMMLAIGTGTTAAELLLSWSTLTSATAAEHLLDSGSAVPSGSTRMLLHLGV